MGGSSTQQPVTQQTTQTKDPWIAAQPALAGIIQGAGGLYQQGVGYQPYTGQTTAGWNPYLLQGVQSGSGIAASELFGSPNVVKAGSYLGDLLTNQGLSAPLESMASTLAGQENPYLQGVLNQQMDKVNSAMSGGGRYGSGAHSAAIAQAIAPTLAQDYMQRQQAAAGIYNQGLQRAGQAAQIAPAIDEARFAGTDRLIGYGQMQRALEQAQLDAQLKLWNAQQAYPWEQLARYNAIAGGAGALGGTQVTSSPGATQPSTMQRVLGGGLAGAGLGSMFGPVGGGIGALGGGLLGLL